MQKPPARFPDLAAVFSRKERGRRAMAALSFSDKLDVLDALRDNAAVLSGRGARTTNRPDHSKHG